MKKLIVPTLFLIKIVSFSIAVFPLAMGVTEIKITGTAASDLMAAGFGDSRTEGIECFHQEVPRTGPEMVLVYESVCHLTVNKHIPLRMWSPPDGYDSYRDWCGICR